MGEKVTENALLDPHAPAPNAQLIVPPEETTQSSEKTRLRREGFINQLGKSGRTLGPNAVAKHLRARPVRIWSQQNNRWDRTHAKGVHQARVLIGVNSTKGHSAFVGWLKAFQDRPYMLAGPAPIGPKIDQQEALGLFQSLIKGRFV